MSDRRPVRRGPRRASSFSFLPAWLATGSLAVVAAGGGVAPPPITAAAQSIGTVEVTVPRANVREAPALSSRVVTQVVRGQTMDLQAIEGDWYKVRLAMGGIRVEAYIAKSVSRVVGPIETGETPAPVPAEPARPEERAGMRVTYQHGSEATWLEPAEAATRVASGRRNDLAAAVSALPPPDAEAPAGNTPATFVWLLPSDASGRAIAEPRPAFIVQFKDVPGLDPSKLTAVLVRLLPAADGSLAVAAVPGRADQAMWGDANWDVMRLLEQEDVRADTQVLEAGAVRLQPAGDLSPGVYAVVVLPRATDSRARTPPTGPPGSCSRRRSRSRSREAVEQSAGREPCAAGGEACL
ncbi:MAG: SH3 domain-containing protein [Vicinamibacterales bacterium]